MVAEAAPSCSTGGQRATAASGSMTWMGESVDEAFRERAAQLAQQARAAATAGRWADAESLARRAVNLNPTNVEGFSILAEVLERRGDHTGAARELTAAVQLEPLRPELAARLIEVWGGPIAFVAILGTLTHLVLRSVLGRFSQTTVVGGLVVITVALVVLVAAAVLRRRRRFAGLDADDRRFIAALDRRIGWNSQARAALIGGGIVIVVLAAATVLFGATTKLSTDMRVGDCFTTESRASIEKVSAIPCELPHATEIYAQFRDPTPIGGAYPGLPAVHAAAFQRCLAPFRLMVGVGYNDQRRLMIHDFVPEQDYWDQGVRDTWCGVSLLDGGQLVGTVRVAPSGGSP
jgi:Septum formation